MFSAEATCWGEELMHRLAHSAVSGMSMDIVVATVEPEHVVVRSGKSTETRKKV